MNKTFSWSDIGCILGSLKPFSTENVVQQVKLLRDSFNERNPGYSLTLRSALDAVKYDRQELDYLPTSYPDVLKLHAGIFLKSYYVLFKDDIGEFLLPDGRYNPYLPLARKFYNLQNAASLADCKGLTILEIRKHE